MSAGPGVERLIANWLAEEAPERAPDRILDAAAMAIDRTAQRRFAAEWRSHSMISRLAVAAVIAVAAVGGAFLLGGPGFGPGPGAIPTPSPSPSPTAQPTQRPTPAPFTGACLLLTSEEAEQAAGIIGVGALPAETGTGNETTCTYSDGGGIVLRVTWTKAGAVAAFASLRDTAGIEVVADLGDEALYDPARHTLYVRAGDAAAAIAPSPAGATAEQRRLAAEAIGAFVVERL